jgi:hypothetical protein
MVAPVFKSVYGIVWGASKASEPMMVSFFFLNYVLKPFFFKCFFRFMTGVGVGFVKI